MCIYMYMQLPISIYHTALAHIYKNRRVKRC